MTGTPITMAIEAIEETMDACAGVNAAMLASVRIATGEADLTAGVGWAAVARLIMIMDDVLGAELSPERKDALDQIAQSVAMEIGHCREER